MSSSTPATLTTITALENVVAWYLTEKMSATNAAVVTQKFLTHDNRLIYLTKCSMSEATVAKIKIQILERVAGGVHETVYQLYSDNRFERSQNAMIFGTQPSAPDTAGVPVDETEANELLALINGLQTTARALV